jgi:hypothetical protein
MVQASNGIVNLPEHYFALDTIRYLEPYLECRDGEFQNMLFTIRDPVLERLVLAAEHLKLTGTDLLLVEG